MTPTEQDILRASLEKTTDAFFRRRSAKRAKIILSNGQAPDQKGDAVGVLAVLSGWVGELIGGAPEDMRDNLFLAFADNVVTIAGIKDEEAALEDMPAHETVQ